MEKFKSIPGSQIGNFGKFNNDGFLETEDPKAIEALKGSRFVEHVTAKKAPEDKKDTPPKKDPEDKK